MKISEITQPALSPEFLQWFRGSKVVNPDGSPKVVFHGTTHDFDQFDRTSDMGYHFASSDIANRRLDMLLSYGTKKFLKGSTGLSVIPAYLRLINPVHMSSDPRGWYSDFIIEDLGHTNSLPEPIVTELRKLKDDAVAAARAQLSTQIVNPGHSDWRVWAAYDRKKSRMWTPLIDGANRVILKRIKEALIQHGYDGVIYPNQYESRGRKALRADDPKNISYVVFSPNQIKGAFNDRPTEGPKFMESAGSMFVSDPRYEAIRQKAQQGLRVWRGARPEGPADPGDFGTGTYYSTSGIRANQYGHVQQHAIKFNNPIVLSVEHAYDLADRYNTLHGNQQERQAASIRLNRDLRAAGFDGLISVNASPLPNANWTELEIVDLRLTDSSAVSAETVPR